MLPYVGVMKTGPDPGLSGSHSSSSIANRYHCGVNSVPPEKIPVMPLALMLLPFSNSFIASASSSLGVVNMQRTS